MVETTLLVVSGKRLTVPRLLKRLLQIAVAVGLTAAVFLVVIVGNGLLVGRQASLQTGINLWLAFIRRPDILSTMVLTAFVTVVFVYWQRNPRSQAERPSAMARKCAAARGWALSRPRSADFKAAAAARAATRQPAPRSGDGLPDAGQGENGGCADANRQRQPDHNPRAWETYNGLFPAVVATQRHDCQHGRNQQRRTKKSRHLLTLSVSNRRERIVGSLSRRRLLASYVADAVIATTRAEQDQTRRHGMKAGGPPCHLPGPLTAGEVAIQRR
jgi:hypothetical protein